MVDVSWSKLIKRFEVDLRTLAIFRIIAGIMVIVDVILRYRSLNFFYTDKGAVPLEHLLPHIPIRRFSIHTVSGDPIFIFILGIIQVLFALLLIVGYKSKTSLAISFLLVVSIGFRNPMVLSYADTTFRLLLFWALFLPIGRRWSIDSIQKDYQIDSNGYTSIATFAILTQMVFIYLVNGIHKSQNLDYWISGESMILLINYDRVTFLFIDYLHILPGYILQLSGIIWFILLLMSPLLIILTGRKRYMFAILYISGHLSIALTMRIGAFSFVAIMGLLLFFQNDFWSDVKTLYGNRVKFPRKVGDYASKIPEIEYNREISDDLKILFTITVFVVVVASTFFMFYTNFQTIGVIDDDRNVPVIQNQTQGMLDIFILNQPEWNFYAYPTKNQSYPQIKIEKYEGEYYDPINKREFSYDRPHSGKGLHNQFETYRHRFYFNNLMKDTDMAKSLNKGISEYYCDRYEAKSITVYEMIEYREADGSTDYSIKSSEIIEHYHQDC